MEKNYFSELYQIDVSERVEKKNGLSYLSWAWAWAEIKKRHPDATYTIYENAEGFPYHHDARTAWVKVGVTVGGLEHIEYLPVMDNRNQSIALDAIRSTDVNKSVQRALTKAIARHGLGLYIYAGEDLPEEQKAKPLTKEHKNALIDEARRLFGENAPSQFKMLTGVRDLSRIPDDQFETLMKKLKEEAK